ncbi:MAG: hypothetical protein V8Q17_06995 [Acutalibacteraceae bacterium]
MVKQHCRQLVIKNCCRIFRGSFTLEEAVEHMKRETRRYAKRQLTWFRRNPNIHWLKVDEMESHEQLVEKAKSIVTQFQF